MKLYKLIAVIIISCCSVSFVACRSGCNKIDTTTENTTENTAEIIALTVDNYSQYFVLQTEIISYNQNNDNQGLGSNVLIANQVTKISVLPLVADIVFDGVIIEIVNGTKIGSNIAGSPIYLWKGTGGTLIISNEGFGSISLTASYDNRAGPFKQLKYAVGHIRGSIKLYNRL